MAVSELLVGIFAVLFLAFCLTAIALIALSKDKDDVAKKSITVLRTLHGDEPPPKPTPPEEPSEPEEDARGE